MDCFSHTINWKQYFLWVQEIHQYPMETTPPPSRVKRHYFTSSLLTGHLQRDNLSFLVVQDRRSKRKHFSPLNHQNQTNKQTKLTRLISKTRTCVIRNGWDNRIKYDLLKGTHSTLNILTRAYSLIFYNLRCFFLMPYSVRMLTKIQK